MTEYKEIARLKNVIDITKSVRVPVVLRSEKELVSDYVSFFHYVVNEKNDFSKTPTTTDYNIKILVTNSTLPLNK